MIRLPALGLLAVALAAGQFVEIEVDAGARAGRLRPAFGIDAPKEEAQARLLLERSLEVPVRVGPDAALRTQLLGQLGSARADDAERPTYDERSIQTAAGELALCELPPRMSPVQAVELAIESQRAAGPAIYYKRRTNGWFRRDGTPDEMLTALALAARMTGTPRLVQVRASAETAQGLAGVSEDGETVQILLTRRKAETGEPGPPAYLLRVRNLPWGADPFAIERYRLDASHSGEPVEMGSGRGGVARVSARFEAPAVELILLRRQDGKPASRVIRGRRRSPPP